MGPLLLHCAGFLVLALAAWDVFVTSLTLRGGGPVSSWAARRIWAALLAVHRRRTNHRLLSFGGGLVVVGVLSVWVVMLAGGWGLVFAGAPQAVVDATTGAPADLAARLYFAGFNLFTLGLGDYKPSGAWGQALTVAASGSGLLGITLAVTYLAPVLSGAVSRQALAGEISLLGCSPRQIVEGARRQGLEAFSGRLDGFAGSILKSAEQHLAYPILHDFHARHRRLSLSLRLAALYDALLILQAGAEDLPPPAAALATAIELYIMRVRHDVMPAAAAGPPPAPDMSGLAVPQAQAETALQQAAETRGFLLQLVEHDGWTWSALTAGP